ncbi:MAG: cation:proton antiporter [Euryarchaeota archaeon]|nr:cation:proton antiporter [Euryarchaeota archaeon]
MVETVALATDFALIIGVAVSLSYVARLTGQPILIAYLLTGLLVGPVLLGVVIETELIDLMAELGLGFLLFLIGLRMQIDEIREIFRPILNLTILGTVLQTLLGLLIAVVFGFSLTEIIVIGLASVFGATPIIVKLLADNDQIDTLPGRIDVGVLVVQNVYLVLLLALFGAGSLDSPLGVATSILTVFVLVGAIGAFAYLSARYVLPNLIHSVADNDEVFFVVGIAWTFLFIVGAEELGLSIEMGAFLAGISLAQVPQSAELAEQVQPITDFFMMVFFTSIGLQLEADQLLAFWVEALVASGVLMAANFVGFALLIYREGFSPETSFVGSLNMVQLSEFSLVLGSLAVAQGFVGTEVLGYLSLLAIVTMSLSTYFINYNYELYRRVEPYLDRFAREDDHTMEMTTREDHAVVIGHDDVTSDVLPVLSRGFRDVVIIDRNQEYLHQLDETEYDLIHGDFSHTEHRNAANLGRAAFVLSSSVQPEVNRTLLEEVNDEATVLVEAERIEDAFDLYERGADYVIVSTVLAREMIDEHLRQYLTDHEAFMDVRDRDIGHMLWRIGDD